MKVVVSTINSKYIHLNNSVYIVDMYLKSDNIIKTYTIKDSCEKVLEDLISDNANYYFFSIYIWNITMYKEILPKLKEQLPNSVIVVGGPEVSYDSDYLLSCVDYIYRGEVNESVNEVLNGKITCNHILYNGNLNTVCNYNNFIHDPKYLDKVDINEHQILYLETSKGCPFKCSYCMSSLESSIINMPIETVFKLIDYACERNVKVVKFLDRTFNIDEDRVKTIMNYIVEKFKSFQSFQFEVAPELISEDLLDYLKTLEVNCFRFEVGIQSIHYQTVSAVDRFHKYENYEDTLRVLCSSTNVVTHFDLIAGLPLETFSNFISSFNTTFKLLPDEYQLGMLKVLNGTKIKKEVELHDIKYDLVAPYQFISTKYLSVEECLIIKSVEDIVDRFYNSNKFKYTFEKLVETYDDIFNLLVDFSNYLQQVGFKLLNYQQYDIYKVFYDYLVSLNSDLCDYVIFDYLEGTVNKPKKFYPTLERKRLNEILQSLVTSEKPLNYMYKHVVVEQLNLDGLKVVGKDLKTNEMFVFNI